MKGPGIFLDSLEYCSLYWGSLYTTGPSLIFPHLENSNLSQLPHVHACSITRSSRQFFARLFLRISEGLSSSDYEEASISCTEAQPQVFISNQKGRLLSVPPPNMACMYPRTDPALISLIPCFLGQRLCLKGRHLQPIFTSRWLDAWADSKNQRVGTWASGRSMLVCPLCQLLGVGDTEIQLFGIAEA